MAAPTVARITDPKNPVRESASGPSLTSGGLKSAGNPHVIGDRCLAGSHPCCLQKSAKMLWPGGSGHIGHLSHRRRYRGRQEKQKARRPSRKLWGSRRTSRGNTRTIPASWSKTISAISHRNSGRRACRPDTRISVYCHDSSSSRFIPIARISGNPEFEKEGRPHYPGNQGIICKAWQKEVDRYQFSFDNPESDSLAPGSAACENWLQEQEVLYAVPRAVAEALTMKSLSFVALRIEHLEEKHRCPCHREHRPEQSRSGIAEKGRVSIPLPSFATGLTNHTSETWPTWLEEHSPPCNCRWWSNRQGSAHPPYKGPAVTPVLPRSIHRLPLPMSHGTGFDSGSAALETKNQQRWSGTG